MKRKLWGQAIGIDTYIQHTCVGTYSCAGPPIHDGCICRTLYINIYPIGVLQE